VLFHTYAFLFGFLPVVLAGWWSLRRPNARLAWLTAASWFFYAWWDWRFLAVMIGSTIVDYFVGLALTRARSERRRRFLLVGSLVYNLAILAYFKYVGFFLDSMDGIAAAVGAPVDVPALQVVLPIGISFYTFNSMSYTIDVYRGRVRPTANVLQYTAFVALFPHLVAGPIVRFSDIEDQLRRLTPRLTSAAAAAGLFFLACGLVKKLIVADTLAPDVDRLYASPETLGFVSGWMAAIGYSLQLYFDFSGYSDMAVGLALLVGFRFPQNFNSPFKAQNISDFWRRWHMTLSAWIRDYLFIPLGGSRHGLPRTVAVLVLTMFLAGLWHGAAWTFVVWGLIHGVFLATHAALRKAGLTPGSAAVNRTITFALVAAAFVVFRSPDIGTAVGVLEAMAGLRGVEGEAQLAALLPGSFVALVVALLVFVNVAPNTWEIRVQPRALPGAAWGVAGALAVMTIAAPHAFLYFQF
jgi:alginate O-acetyltransferase complex protein AlgI